MPYLEYTFSPISSAEDLSVLIAELMEHGFDSFAEEDNAVLAYIHDEIDRDFLLSELSIFRKHPEVKILVQQLETKNWNEEWEKNYPPVTIAGKCHVRAPFHPPIPGMQYDIVIEPKMAFGTAHHDTTQLMAGWLMDLDIQGKDLLDMGCGTGILAILANKMGARSVMGIDNDIWAWQNARDNFRISNIPEYRVLMGDAGMIGTAQFDIILANINRNTLLKDLGSYAQGLRPNGDLLLSGFYHSDAEDLKHEALTLGLSFIGIKTMNDWTVMLFRK